VQDISTPPLNRPGGRPYKTLPPGLPTYILLEVKPPQPAEDGQAGYKGFFSDHPEDRVKDYQKVKETLYKRALPLAIASVALALVFTPDTIHIILLSLSHTQHKGWKAFFDYNAVSASLALITFATALFACHLLSLVFKLINLKRRLDPRN